MFLNPQQQNKILSYHATNTDNRRSWLLFYAEFLQNSTAICIQQNSDCTLTDLNPGFGGPWNMLRILLGYGTFIMLQGNRFAKKKIISSTGSKVLFWQFFISAKMALFNPCMKLKNMTKRLFLKHYMFQGWPKPGSVKVQTETFLKRDSLSACQIKHQIRIDLINVLKYGSEEKGSSFCKCSILLGIIMSKKQERFRSELLSENKITNLLVFVT
jgi:hypothetical protein